MKYYSLTTPQQNIWNLQKYYSDTAISNLCGAIFYKEKRDSERLCLAICKFIESQSGMRLRFCEKEKPTQYISEEIEKNIPVLTFISMKEFNRYAEEFAKNPIGLAEGAMYRFVVFRVGDKSGVLFSLSHLIADAWTCALMANRVDEAYRMIGQDADFELPQADYRSFIEEEKNYRASERCQKDKAYWEKKYTVRSDGTVLFEKSPIKTHIPVAENIEAKRTTRTLPPALEYKIKAYCQRYSVTPAVLFETAVIIYLSKINPGNGSITIGVPVLNRSGAKEKGTVGMFISTMPLTIEVGKELTVPELTGRIAGEHMGIFRHQRYPYGDILQMCRERPDSFEKLSGNLYDVLVSYQNAKTDTEADTKWYFSGYSEIPLAVHIDNRDGKTCHTLNVDYQTGVFSEEEADYLIDRLEFILGQIAEDGEKKLKDIRMITDTEYRQVTETFNDTAVDYPKDRCVHELFEEQAGKTPDKVALVAVDQTLTYRELNEQANRVANALIEKQVKAGDIVAFALKRKSYMITVMLGILKSGAAYMPVDADYPQERIDYMLSDSRAKIFITEGNYPEYTEYSNIQNPNLILDSLNPCYCIYTSGSTGKPKGTLLHHRGIVNLLSYKNLYSSLDKCSRVVLLTTITFDVASQEIFTVLLNGLTGYLMGNKNRLSVAEVLEEIEYNQIDMLFCTPSYLNILSSKKEYALSLLKNVKSINLAGEKFYLNDILKSQIANFGTVFENQYGPAETHVITTTTIRDLSDITIGRPIANTQIYIVDEDLGILPIGVAGELCIAGDGVGLGYLNRPELTAERFIQNPFATEENGHGKTMYRTGDLARWRADGEIEYLGRIDTQVKIRGLRIELGEIESVMSGFPDIALCAVADKKDENGRQYLVGYYTLSGSGEAGKVDGKELRKHLSGKLPSYMIPNYFMELEAMPMTPSGKLDRKNLPVPDFSEERETYIPPETDTEVRLAGIWEKLLKLPQIGKEDDFFALGGDSLLAISLLSELEAAFSIRLSIKELLENPVLGQMARVIGQAGKETDIIVPQHQDRYVLLPQQKAIYAACQKEPDSLLYNMPAKIRLPHGIDREKLKRCLLEVTECRRILKSRIVSEDGELYGVCEKTAEPVIEEHVEEQDFIRPFKLDEAPLFRAGFTEDALLLDIHHIIADGETVSLLLRDVARAYQGKPLQEKELWYGDYAEYFYQSDFREHRNFYQGKFSHGFERTELPEAETGQNGGESRFYRIPMEVMTGAKTFARENALTDTMVFWGVYGILLSKYTGKRDVLGSIILQNRVHADLADMAGMFVNTLPASFQVGGDTRTYFMRIKEMILGLFQYQELPFWEIAEAVGVQDKSVVNTSFVYQAGGQKQFLLDGKVLVPEYLDTHTAKFDFSMEITPLDAEGEMRLEYNREKYDAALIDELAAAYVRILEQLSKERIADISVLSDEMYRQVTETFNDTAVDYPKDKCVHELFEEQARKTPDRTALVFHDRKFTYKELDAMSNSLAHELKSKGIGRGDVVPIIAKRSWHIIVAMFAILKTGAAYMPVSPEYPEDRIISMLETAKSRLALTCGFGGKPGGVECMELETVDYEKDAAAVVNVSRPEDLCYVIFTSGSTGTPKGVSIDNRNVVNYCTNNNNNNVCHRIVKNEYRRIVSVTNFVFDIFVTETLLPLLNGMTVYFADEEESMRQDKLAGLVEREKIEVIQTTPTKMRSFLLDKERTDYLKNFKAVILGGEAFPSELYRELREHTDAHIFNIYGPAETTVWSSNAEVTNGDITIGRPIANTQIYIVGEDLGILPIGVAGELCIAGDGVGLGYLNRPELTAERFIQNPFATEENGHGKTMYRTGDLARWRADGELEYLGRIDTQVKIRGLRIELGEIESVMSSYPGIALCAVADKKDENGRQYLVGYYTLSGSGEAGKVDGKELRKHLSGKLPKYMVPNYFMELEAMPMTPSGKLDRKNLPVPDFKIQEESYVAPETDREKCLCRLAGELLEVERFGMEDDFFEVGGDSLTAITYVIRAHEEGIEFSIQNVFDYPTVRQLCDFLDAGISEKVYFKVSEFEKYRKLFAENVINETFVPRKRSLGNVLLTGATGFLGAHVLDCLMRETDDRVYCLVRSMKEDDRRGRLKDVLDYYFGSRYEEEIGKRIIPVTGDIEQEGLTENLPPDVQTVIHTAASVKHFGSYEYFRRVNCEGTRHVMQYAKAVGARLVHISTLSVSGNSMAEDFSVYRPEEEKQFDETSLYIGQPLDNVYIRSKFEAERVVYDAVLSGLDAKVIRVGNLTNRHSDFKFQPNYRENAFLMRAKALLEFGMLPDYLMSLYAEFSPVDKTAEGIVKIAEYAGEQSIFHVYNSRHLYYGRFLEIAHELGIPLRVVSGEEFYEALQQSLKQKGKEYIYEAFQNDLDEQGRLVYDSNIRIMSDFTLWFLKKVGFSWNEIDMEYIRGYVEYFRKLGFLEV